MPTRAMLAALLLTSAPAFAKPASPPADPGIAVGQVLDDALGKTIDGWLYMQGSLYPQRTTKNFVTTETQECCVAVFNKGNRYVVARTEALTKTPSGGVLKERIVDLTRITAQPGEQAIECSLIGQTAFLTLQDQKTHWLRSVVLNGDSFVTVAWKDPGGFCSYGD